MNGKSGTPKLAYGGCAGGLRFCDIGFFRSEKKKQRFRREIQKYKLAAVMRGFLVLCSKIS